MTWKIVRLELDRSAGLPGGSAGRAFLIRVPIDGEGQVDRAELERTPERATVRRFWPNEPDFLGHLAARPGFSGLRLAGHGADCCGIFLDAATPFRLGALIAVTQPDGRELPFRIVRISAFAPAGTVPAENVPTIAQP